jgi:hypothetical protein
MRNNGQQKIVDFIVRHKNTLFYCGMAVIILGLLFPEVARAVNLEDQLDRVNTLTTDKVKKYGITGAAILSVIGAMARGNIKLVGVVIVIAIMLALLLAWIAGGMVV